MYRADQRAACGGIPRFLPVCQAECACGTGRFSGQNGTTGSKKPMNIRKKTFCCRFKSGNKHLRSPSRTVGGLRLQAVDQFGNMTKYRYKQPKAHQLE